MDNKDSEFYQKKLQKQILNFRDVCKELPDYAVKFLQSKEFNSSYSTLKEYAYDLKTFFTFLQNNNPQLNNLKLIEIPVNTLELLNEDDFLEYQHYLRMNVLSGKTKTNNNKSIARKITSLRGLYGYLKQKNYISIDIKNLIPVPKYSDRKTEIKRLHTDANNNEVNEFIQGLDGILSSDKLSEHQKSYIARDLIRDTAILHLFLGTGIRVSECEGLDVSDVDFKEKNIRIKRKGGFYDVVYFGANVEEKLLKYINVYRTPEQVKIYGSALFLSATNERMGTAALRQIVEKYTLIICGKRLTPHKLRATYGTHLYKETKDIRLVADVLGHTNINTTAKHYAAQLEENKKNAANIRY